MGGIDISSSEEWKMVPTLWVIFPKRTSALWKHFWVPTLTTKISLVHTGHSHPQDLEKSACTQILKPLGHE